MEEIDRIVDRYYRELEKCLSRQWSKIIKKFPPNALRSAVRRVVEHHMEAGVDPDEFDWCTHFSAITDYETVNDFLNDLGERGLLPQRPISELEEALIWLERQASDLGYRIVKEEEWARATGEYERLRSELNRLRKQRKELEARLKELEEKVMAIEVAREVRLAKPRARPVRDVMTYDEFLGRVTIELQNIGIPLHIVASTLSENEKFLRDEYTITTSVIKTADKLLVWIAREYIPTRCMVVTLSDLIQRGVYVRPPNPVTMYGKIMRPSINYIKPRFDSWIEDLRSQNFTVRMEPVPVVSGSTHLIHDPLIKVEKIRVSVCEDRISIVECDAISYLLDEQKKVVYYHYYRSAYTLFKMI